jgi:hypothetical protein
MSSGTGIGLKHQPITDCRIRFFVIRKSAGTCGKDVLASCDAFPAKEVAPDNNVTDAAVADAKTLRRVHFSGVNSEASDIGRELHLLMMQDF